MTDDFGYLNARIRVRSARLLPESFFREALRLGFPELLKVLAESIYGAYLVGDALADVDLAVTLHLNRTIADLPRLVAGRAREAVSLLLMRADLANLKTILRAKSAGWSVEDILGRLDAGALSPAIYQLLAEAPDTATIAQLLSLQQHPLGGALRKALRVEQEPLALEVALDRAFFAATLRRARELDQPYLAGFLSAEIDGLNLATGVKLSTMGFDGQATDFFLQGGHWVGFPLFQRLASGETVALEELAETDFDSVTESRDLAALEHHLRCFLLAKAHTGVKDVLGAGLALDYIQRKTWEGGRIRLISRRAYYNLSADELEKEVLCY
ncbi:MAG: V-type ATPase subunit [Desulfobacterales bacterium]